MGWFRMYDEIVDDPKVQRLPLKLFRFWVNLLALCNANKGVIPGVSAIAFKTRMSEAEASACLGSLSAAGLLDGSGAVMKPHNWDKRQYKSDVSTPRVQAFRERQSKHKGNVSEAPPEAETEVSDAGASASPATPRPADVLKAKVFGPVLDYLKANSGRPEAACRSELGRLRKLHGDGAVIEAAAAAEREGKSDPIGAMEFSLGGMNGRARKPGGRQQVQDDYRADMLAGVGIGPH